MTNTILKKIEYTLLSDEKSFGLLCVMGHYDPKTDSDIDEYLLCTAVIRHDNRTKNGKSVFIGCDTWILKDKEIIVTAEELVNVFNIFRKCKRELICDLYVGIGEFDISEYLDRLKKLDI